MIEILKPYVEKKESDLNSEERNILCVAYKNAIGLRRIAWRAACKVTKIGKYKNYDTHTTKY